MPKNLRTFLEDMHRAYPSEVVTIGKSVNPMTHDVTAIIKQLGVRKNFPILIFDRPLNGHGRANDIKLVMSAENTQRKVQVALGIPPDMVRAGWRASVCGVNRPRWTGDRQQQRGAG